MTRLIGVWAVVSIVSVLLIGCRSRSAWAMPDLMTQSPRPMPTVALSHTCTPAPKEAQVVTFTVVYDNNIYDPVLRSAWGFSCWVETSEMTVLFDTGGDGATLLSNMAELGLDPGVIDAVVLSHAHGDHTGGLVGLLDTGIRPTVYVPQAFSASFKADVQARTDLVEVADPVELESGVYTTGQVGSSIVEQALVVETRVGSVIVTGCAHPGIVDMVRKGQELAPGKVALVLGGFHLGSASKRQIENILAAFRQMDVQRIAPCHCTGDVARRMFVEAYGTRCTLAGVGWVVSVGSGE